MHAGLVGTVVSAVVSAIVVSRSTRSGPTTAIVTAGGKQHTIECAREKSSNR
jgi:hypothetical protein